MRTALLAGATGLVGGQLLRRLLDDAHWDRVVTIGRRAADVDHDKLEQRIAELGDLADLAGGGDLGRVDDAFSALGTTIRAAGSQAAFRAVDHDAVVALARGAQAGGASSFLHVTAMGADPGSRIFYNRVKGEAERDVEAVGIPTTVAFRPSILDGDRAETRVVEQAGLAVMRALAPALGRFRPTAADDVATAMLATARADRRGSLVVDAREIRRLARAS